MKLGKKVSAAIASAGLALGIIATAAPAQAAPVTVSNGIPISFGNPDAGRCTLGAVGTDAAGRKVAITAAHCATNIPAEMKDRNIDDPRATVWDKNTRQQIGKIRFISSDQVNNDFLTIELNSDAVLKSQGPGIRVDSLSAPLGFGALLTKDGTTTGVTTGPVIQNNAGVLHTWALAAWGDSGGPAVRAGTGEWAGITSRIGISFGPWQYISSQNILSYMDRFNAVGEGFSPVKN